jgi:hypothetical protein
MLWKPLSRRPVCKPERSKRLPLLPAQRSSLLESCTTFLPPAFGSHRGLRFHIESIDDLKACIRARKAVNPKIDVAVFKEMTGGLTRKYAIPLLEYLDRERVTRRVGNEREIL